MFSLFKIILFLSVILSFLLFKDSIFSYFSQDDFYHLRTIMDKNISDMPLFFITQQEGQTFYRPLSREIFNLLMYKTFGLNSLIFHLVNFFLILLIGYLVFVIIYRISKNKFLALLTFLIYLLSPIHSVELYYLSSVQQLLATIFLLISILSFLKCEQSVKYFFLSLLFYILALFSHSMSVMFPVIIITIDIFLNRKNFFKKQNLIIIFAFIFIDLLYLTGSSIVNLPDQLPYEPSFLPNKIANTFFWYSSWSFGLPEMLVDFIGPGFRINPRLWQWYNQYLIIIIPIFILLISFLVAVALKIYRKMFADKLILLFGILFIISLSPFLIFPLHKFVYYLSFPIIWFSAILSYFLFSFWIEFNKLRLAPLLFIFLFFCLSFQTIEINRLTHWSAKRAVAAEYLMNEIKTKYPVVPKGAIFYIKNDPNYPNITKEWGSSSKQAFYILSGSDALRLFYKDSKIVAYYNDVSKMPVTSDKSKIITYTAIFPF